MGFCPKLPKSSSFNDTSCLICVESGMELMVQLTVLTGIQFSSPTGIIGSYNHGKLVSCLITVIINQVINER